jgi:hypothetical protein
VRLSEIEGERGERVLYLGRIGGMGSVSLREAQSDAHPVPYDRYGVGLHHLAGRPKEISRTGAPHPARHRARAGAI